MGFNSAFKGLMENYPAGEMGDRINTYAVPKFIYTNIRAMYSGSFEV